MSSSGRSAALPRFAAGGAVEAYLLLTFTMACWGANAVASRLLVGEASPMVITWLRWLIVTLLVLSLAGRSLVASRHELGRHWLQITLMAASGFTIFNALFYISAHYTTAVNIAILQGAIPVFVFVGAAAFFGTRLALLQIVGIAATLIGVAVVATAGHILSLAAFRFNRGDALMLIACVLYAGYTLALRNRPRVPALAFFTALSFVALLTSTPLLGYEMVSGTALWPSAKGWLVLAFTAIFPSLFGQLAYMRGVRLIGPGRAGLFTNLVPIFGALFGVAVLSEPFAFFHLTGLMLVTGGILVAEAAGRRREASAAAGKRAAGP
jgi:drug/metabolite transporter (DMT)-like permease